MVLNPNEIRKIRMKLKERNHESKTQEKALKAKKKEPVKAIKKSNPKKENNSLSKQHILVAELHELKDIEMKEIELVKRDIKEIRKLTEQNQAYAKDTFILVKKIKQILTLRGIYSFLKIILILTPFILAYFYFLPFVEEIKNRYVELNQNMIELLQYKNQ